MPESPAASQHPPQVPSAGNGTLWALNGRRGDIVFYGLLAGAWIVAGAFALRNVHGHPAAPHETNRGRTSVSTARSASRDQASATTTRRRTRPEGAIDVTITASRGRSWIVVRSRSSRGPIRYEDILEQGHTLREHGPALWTQIGAVGNVDVRVNGHVVRLGRSALGGVLLSTGGIVASATGPYGVVGS